MNIRILNFLTIFILTNILIVCSFVRAEEGFTKKIEEINNKGLAIEKLSKEWVDIFHERNIQMNVFIENLTKISNKFDKNPDYQGLGKDYKYVIELWRSAADHSFDNISGTAFKLAMPPVSIIDSEKLTEDQTVLIKENINILSLEMLSAFQTFDALQEKDSLQYNAMLILMGKIRSSIYHAYKKTEDQGEYNISEGYYEDLSREIHLIPVRWMAMLYAKLIEMQNNLKAGIDGKIFVAKEAFGLLFFLTVIALFVWAFQRIVGYFERVSDAIFQRVYSLGTPWFYPFVIQLFNRAIPWVTLLVGAKILEQSLQSTSFREITSIFPYLDIYIYYKFLYLFLVSFLVRLKTLKIINTSYRTHIALQKEGEIALRIGFSIWAGLYSIEAIVGEVLMYDLAIKLSFIIVSTYMILTSYKWRKQLMMYALRHKAYGNAYVLKIRGMKYISIFMPFLFLICIICSFIFKKCFLYLSQFEIFKRVHAFLILEKLKHSQFCIEEAKIKSLPGQYLDAFSFDQELNVTVERRKESKAALHIIREWVEGNRSKNSLLINGSKGSEKEMIFKHLFHTIEGPEKIMIEIPAKILNAEELYIILEGHSLKVHRTNGEKTISFPSHEKDTVIYVKDFHNLYLSRAGAFSAIDAFLKIIQNSPPNIFWCMSCHKESWYFLSKVKPEIAVIDSIVELYPWSAQEIKDFIFSIHKRTKMLVNFDLFSRKIGALKASSIDKGGENNFFDVLWEISDGNPVLAVYLWLESVGFDGLSTIVVLTPPILSEKLFDSMSDETHLVCASLHRHESLNSDNMISLSILEEKGFFQEIKAAISNKFIVCDQHNNFFLNPMYSGSIVRSLRRKHYVYT